MSYLKELSQVTLEDFLAMPKEERLTYELIDGVVMMSPRPAIKHQRISGNLYYQFRTILKDKHCEPIQEADLILDEQNFVPDLMVVCEENLDDMAHYDKPPLLVVEILSPSSASRDYFVKRRAYETLGVQEYWIVSPEETCIMVICFTTDEECRYCEGTVKSYVLPEVSVPLEDVFS